MSGSSFLYGIGIAALMTLLAYLFVVQVIALLPVYHQLPVGVYEISRSPIESLETSSSIQGSFVLGTGSISDKMYYYYYVLDPDGGFRLEKRLADSSKIYMDLDNVTAPYVRTVFTETPDMKTLCNAGETDTQCIDEIRIFHPYTYQFHVPKGAVIHKYNGMVRDDQ